MEINEKGLLPPTMPSEFFDRGGFKRRALIKRRGFKEGKVNGNADIKHVVKKKRAVVPHYQPSQEEKGRLETG